MVVEDALRRLAIGIEDVLQQPYARHRLAGPSRERGEEVELDAREIDRPAVHLDVARCEVEDDAPEAQRAAAPQIGPSQASFQW